MSHDDRSPYAALHTVREVLPGIADRAGRYDVTGDFPEEDLRVLAHIGAYRWAIPQEFAGEALSPIELHFRYEAIASASLATALILTQRDSAVGIIDASPNEALRSDLLPKLAAGKLFATVGIAQLTTSRQHLGPALTARPDAAGYVIDGAIPWSTGAGKSEYVVAGAVVSEGPDAGKQILFALPTATAGVATERPMPLAALRHSWTTQVTCSDVHVPRSLVLVGPVDKALSRRKPTLGLSQVFLALGHCRGALNLIEALPTDAARSALPPLLDQWTILRNEVLDLCAPNRAQESADRAPAVRARANDLTLRATHTAIALYKGAALLADHPAQRLARESLFLLVWSCPAPVIDCTVDLLANA